jgi:hypothetical protein
MRPFIEGEFWGIGSWYPKIISPDFFGLSLPETGILS